MIVKWILDETEFCPGVNPAKSRHKILQSKDSEGWPQKNFQLFCFYCRIFLTKLRKWTLLGRKRKELFERVIEKSFRTIKK